MKTTNASLIITNNDKNRYIYEIEGTSSKYLLGSGETREKVKVWKPTIKELTENLAKIGISVKKGFNVLDIAELLTDELIKNKNTNLAYCYDSHKDWNVPFVCFEKIIVKKEPFICKFPKIELK